MEILYFLPFLVLLIIAISMFVQGWMIFHNSYGYHESPKIRKHPEMQNVRQGEKLMTVSFGEEDSTNLDLQQLYERIQKQRMEELFSEPYDGDMEEED